MQNLITSTIRTVVPAIVGQLVTWLVTIGIVLDAATVGALEAALVGVVGALVTGLYYYVVRKLAVKYPDLEKLLGSAKAPVVYEKR